LIQISALLHICFSLSYQLKFFNAAENFAILRSIIDTAIKNNQNVLDTLGVIATYKRN